jgi:outer membrane immunogenic protein
MTWDLSPRGVAAALTITGAMALAAPTFAQEQPAWSGFYVGANIGGTWGDNSLESHASAGNGAVVIPPGDIALLNTTGNNSNNKSGFIGGIEGGYNYRMGDWLLGLETEFSALDVNQSQSNTYQSTVSPATYTINQRAKTNWMWTLRPRVGYVAGPWLFYGTAGLAMSDIKVQLDFADNRNPPNLANTEDSSTRTGWAGGLGVGYAYSPVWSFKGEWLYTDFGSVSTTAASQRGFVTLTSDAKVRANSFRVGVDYHF